VPVGRGHSLNPTGVWGVLANGWQVTGIVLLQSGMPFAVTQSTNFNAFAGFGVQRPNIIANPDLLPATELQRNGSIRMHFRRQTSSH
jgi:hypothetical protein